MFIEKHKTIIIQTTNIHTYLISEMIQLPAGENGFTHRCKRLLSTRVTASLIHLRGRNRSAGVLCVTGPGVLLFILWSPLNGFGVELLDGPSKSSLLPTGTKRPVMFRTWWAGDPIIPLRLSLIHILIRFYLVTILFKLRKHKINYCSCRWQSIQVCSKRTADCLI